MGPIVLRDCLCGATAENASIGATLITVGMIMTAVPILCMVGIAKMMGGRRQTQSSGVGMYAQGQGGAPAMPMQQQPQLMGQQPMMGSVPGGYAPPQMGVTAAANPVYGGIPGAESPFPSSAPM